MKTIWTVLVLGLFCGSASAQERFIYGVRQRPQDPFLGSVACAIVDAQRLVAYPLDQAARALAPCAQELARKYGVPVRAESGAVGVDGGRGTAPGILLRVPAEIKKDCHILLDLSYAIGEKRKGRLLGLPAEVWSGDLEGPEAFSAQRETRAPAWLDGQSLRVDARRTKIQADGALRLVLRDKDDNEADFFVPEVSDQATVVFTRATDEELGPYRVASLEAEPLKSALASLELPAGMAQAERKAVLDFFAGFSAPK